jgi:hypothetical protein
MSGRASRSQRTQTAVAMAGERRASSRGRQVIGTLALALAVSAVLQAAHRGQPEAGQPPLLAHAIRDGLLIAPAAIVALATAAAIAGRAVGWAGLSCGGWAQATVRAAAAALLLGVLSVPGATLHGRLFGGEHVGVSAGEHAVGEGGLVVATVLASLACGDWHPAPGGPASGRPRDAYGWRGSSRVQRPPSCRS